MKLEKFITEKAKFKYLKFEENEDGFTAILIDKKGDQIIMGYGKTKITALDDLHSCLI